MSNEVGGTVMSLSLDRLVILFALDPSRSFSSVQWPLSSLPPLEFLCARFCVDCISC